MSWTLIGSRVGQSSGGGSFTSPVPLDTTGATLLACVVSSYTIEADPVLTDLAGNTWSLAGVSDDGVIRLALFFVDSNTPLAHSAHTFSVALGGGAPSYPAGAFLAFTGSAASPGDQFGSRTTGSSSVADASTSGITPSANVALLLAAVACQSATTGLGIDNGLTVQEYLPYSAGNYFGIGVAWKEQATAALINPQFYWSAAASSCSLIGSFNAGGGSTASVARARQVKQAIKRGSYY